MPTLIEQVTAALQNGDRNLALQLLQKTLGENPRDISAWLLLARAVHHPDKKRECYRRVLRIDRANAEAQAGLAALDAPDPEPEMSAPLPEPDSVPAAPAPLEPVPLEKAPVEPVPAEQSPAEQTPAEEPLAQDPPDSPEESPAGGSPAGSNPDDPGEEKPTDFPGYFEDFASQPPVPLGWLANRPAQSAEAEAQPQESAGLEEDLEAEPEPEDEAQADAAQVAVEDGTQDAEAEPLDVEAAPEPEHGLAVQMPVSTLLAQQAAPPIQPRPGRKAGAPPWLILLVVVIWGMVILLPLSLLASRMVFGKGRFVPVPTRTPTVAAATTTADGTPAAALPAGPIDLSDPALPGAASSTPAPTATATATAPVLPTPLTLTSGLPEGIHPGAWTIENMHAPSQASGPAPVNQIYLFPDGTFLFLGWGSYGLVRPDTLGGCGRYQDRDTWNFCFTLQVKSVQEQQAEIRLELDFPNHPENNTVIEGKMARSLENSAAGIDRPALAGRWKINGSQAFTGTELELRADGSASLTGDGGKSELGPFQVQDGSLSFDRFGPLWWRIHSLGTVLFLEGGNQDSGVMILERIPE